MAALSIRNLQFSYLNNAQCEPVFSGLHLELRAGQIACLVGSSGCGKTTLLNLVAGFIRPSGGTIDFGGGSGSTRQVGYIFQQDALLPWRTVRGNLNLPFELGNRGQQGADGRIARQLEAFRMEPPVLSKYPSQLSGGMRQRISIMQCLLAGPQFLLLDEPFSSLDFFTKLQIESELRDLVVGSDLAALFVTHDIDEAIAIGDRVIVMGRAPRGIVGEIEIDFGDSARPGPEEARSHGKFGEYFGRVWQELRNAN